MVLNAAEDILGFRCPHGSNVNSDLVVLQFGDHERLPNVGYFLTNKSNSVTIYLLLNRKMTVDGFLCA